MDKGNTRLVKFRIRQVLGDGAAGRPSEYGEPSFVEKDLLALHPEWILEVWIDYGVTRRVEIRGENTDVAGELELRDFVQQKLVDLGYRRLRTGDLVMFSTSNRWYVLGKSQDDAGLFQSLPVEKFDLLYSDKPRTSNV